MPTPSQASPSQASPAPALSSPDRFSLVVLGMHRSGTSALSGVLAELGCATPATPIVANDENRKGFFESRRIARLNENLLFSAGLSWNSQPRLDPETCDPEMLARFRDRAADILAGEFGDAPGIVLKDPRFCRMLPLWQEVLSHTGRDTLYVLVHRNPVEVAQSLNRRDQLWEPYVLLLWLHHVLEAEAATRGQRRAFTSYHAVLRDWRHEIARIETVLNFAFPVRPDAAAERIGAFISPDLRRNQAAQAPLALPGWVQSAHDILNRWVAHGEDPADYARLDEIQEALDGAGPVFTPILQRARELQEKYQEIARQHREEKQIAIEASKAEQDLRQELDCAEMRRAEISQQLDYCETRLREVEAERALQATQAADLEATLATREARIAEMEHQRGAAAAERADLEATLATRETRIAEMERQRDAAAAERADLEATLATRETRIAEMEHQRDAAAAERADLARRLDASQERATALTRSLSAADTRLAELQNTATAQIARLEADLATRDQALDEASRKLRQAAVMHQNLRHQVHKHRHAYQELLLSHSWKITAPVRWLGRALSRGRK